MNVARLEALVLEYTDSGECLECGAEVCRTAPHDADCVIGQVDAALREVSVVRAAPREPPDVRRVVLWAQDLETVLERIFAVSDDDRSHAENEVLYDALGMMRRELKAAIEALAVEMRESIAARNAVSDKGLGVGGERAAGPTEKGDG